MTLKDNKLLATILNPRVVLVAYISFKTLQYAIAVTSDERSVIYLASLASHCVIAFFAFKNIRWALLMMSVMVGIPGLMGFVMGVSSVPDGVTLSSVFYAVFGGTNPAAFEHLRICQRTHLAASGRLLFG